MTGSPTAPAATGAPGVAAHDTLSGGAGTPAADVLTGNARANVIDGGGGA